ncbi:MAG TPA: polymer-forming cytoskeletal protein [Chloroflexota bacterium]|jgi:cytoskeletal protein CcmA (bactofilin family)|nr:polymer-forming cytoskeletal protein [Chloroflexota bacterium]
MGLFGSKPEDGMKEFERLRRSLRPAARPTLNGASPDEDEDGPPLEPPMSNVTVQPLSAHHVAAPTAVSAIGQASVVGPGSVWHGTLTVDGSLRIQGQVTGEILVRDAVHISEGAEVDAKVRAAVVVVAGHLRGEVEAAERLEISSTGRVQAELVTKALVVHDGAVVEGQLRMVRAEPAEGAAPSDDSHSRSLASAPVAALPTVESAVA